MVSISRRPRTVKEFDEIIQEYLEIVIPKYRAKAPKDLIAFDISAWANSELEIFSGYNECGHPTKGYAQYVPDESGNLIESWTPTDILRTADGYHLKLIPNRWMVLFRKGIEDKDRNEIFIFYVLDIESRKGGYETIWMNPPKLLSVLGLRRGKIFQDWGPRGWAANANAEWAYLDVAKDTGGFINWPFENPLHRGGSV